MQSANQKASGFPQDAIHKLAGLLYLAQVFGGQVADVPTEVTAAVKSTGGKVSQQQLGALANIGAALAAPEGEYASHKVPVFRLLFAGLMSQCSFDIITHARNSLHWRLASLTFCRCCTRCKATPIMTLALLVLRLRMPWTTCACCWTQRLWMGPAPKPGVPQCLPGFPLQHRVTPRGSLLPLPNPPTPTGMAHAQTMQQITRHRPFIRLYTAGAGTANAPAAAYGAVPAQVVPQTVVARLHAQTPSPVPEPPLAVKDVPLPDVRDVPADCTRHNHLLHQSYTAHRTRSQPLPFSPTCCALCSWHPTRSALPCHAAVHAPPGRPRRGLQPARHRALWRHAQRPGWCFSSMDAAPQSAAHQYTTLNTGSRARVPRTRTPSQHWLLIRGTCLAG